MTLVLCFPEFLYVVCLSVSVLTLDLRVHAPLLTVHTSADHGQMYATEQGRSQHIITHRDQVMVWQQMFHQDRMKNTEP